MKSQDIVVLLKLISSQDQEMEKGADRLRAESVGGDPYSLRNLETFCPGCGGSNGAPSRRLIGSHRSSGEFIRSGFIGTGMKLFGIAAKSAWAHTGGITRKLSRPASIIIIDSRDDRTHKYRMGLRSPHEATAEVSRPLSRNNGGTRYAVIS